MNIIIEKLCFDFNGKGLFNNLSLALCEDDSPAIILGPSGCGKTTLLRLIAGLLPLSKGSIKREGVAVSFVFQESRLLPWYTILQNITLPLEKTLGKDKSRERAFHFLELVEMENMAGVFPDKLSGGQKQRAAIARAFAYPGDILLMDEPFQSLDIPLRLELMDLSLMLLEREKRKTIMVTHDPREAAFMGRRVIVLGQPPQGIVFDERINLAQQERGYGSSAAGQLEKRLIERLKN